MTMLLTNSRLKTSRECSRKEWIRYQLGLESAGEDKLALVVGDCWHYALEHLYLALKLGTPIDECSDFTTDKLMSRVQETGLDEFESARLRAMLAGYFARWYENDLANLTVLSVEREFRAPLERSNHTLAGKLDVMVKVNGVQYIMEHKTSGEDFTQGSVYRARLAMDSQVSMYHKGARALGYDPVGCIYNVAGKPGIKPFKATPEESRKYVQKTGKLYANQRQFDETPTEFFDRCVDAITEDPLAYYQRIFLVRTELEEMEFTQDLWAASRVIDELNKLNYHPKNPDACFKYGGACPYFAACTGQASLADETKFRRMAKVHPELESDK